MNTLIKSAVMVGFAMLVSGCGSSIRITDDYDREADFSGYRTFVIADLSSSTEGSPELSELNQRRIRDAINGELHALGYTADEYGPDLKIYTHVAVRSITDFDTYTSYYGRRGYRWGGRETQVTIRDYREGTLVIDIVDTSNKQLIWQGVARGTVDRNDIKNEARINEAVAGIFKRYNRRRAGNN